MSAVTATSVALEPHSVLGRALAPVLASLPDEFIAALPAGDGSPRSGKPAVVVVDGHLADWVERLREAIPVAKAVLLREPSFVPIADLAGEVLDLAQLARTSAVPVVVDRRWSGAPGVDAFAEVFAPQVESFTSVTVLLVEGDSSRSADDSLLDALGLVRAAGSPVAGLEEVRRWAGSWSATGRTTTGAALHLQGVRSEAGTGAVLTGTSGQRWLSVRVPDVTSAAPAMGSCADADGERILPSLFEPAARFAWRRLADQLQHAPAHPGDELVRLADDLRAAQRAGA